jgi:hypothetical protein
MSQAELEMWAVSQCLGRWIAPRQKEWQDNELNGLLSRSHHHKGRTPTTCRKSSIYRVTAVFVFGLTPTIRPSS